MCVLLTVLYARHLPHPLSLCCCVCSLLTVLYSQVRHTMEIEDQLDAVQEELNEMKGIKKPTPVTTKQVMAGASRT